MAKVFNIQRFSLNDGPGIRTTVFVKGCPLRCVWCHNPESKARESELLYDAKRCVGCTRCASACTNGVHIFENGIHRLARENCISCFKCVDACPYSALEVSGKETSAADALSEVIKDRPFYDTSGGGLTISGGEPLFSFDFTLELLRLAKEAGIHTAIETSGFAQEEQIREIAGYTDLFLYDVKETDPERHKAYTGVDNKIILSNLRMLSEIGAAIVLRCPIIPGYNDRDEHFLNISRLADELRSVIAIDVEPYHPLGESKAESLGKDYPLAGLGFPDEKTVKGWIERIASGTSKPVRRG